MAKKGLKITVFLELDYSTLSRVVPFCKERELPLDKFISEAIEDCMKKYQSWEDMAAQYEREKSDGHKKNN